MKRDELRRSGGYIGRPWWLGIIPQAVLKETAKTVFCAIMDRLGKRDIAYPSLPRIEFDTGLSYAVVNDAIVRLKALGLLTARRGQSNIYTLCVPTPLDAVYSAYLSAKETAAAEKRDLNVDERRQITTMSGVALKQWGQQLRAAGGPDIDAMNTGGFMADPAANREKLKQYHARKRDKSVAHRDKMLQSATPSNQADRMGTHTTDRMGTHTSNRMGTHTQTTEGNDRSNYRMYNRPAAGERATPATSASPTLPFGHGLPDQAEGTPGQLPAQVTTEGSATASKVHPEDFEDLAGQGFDEDEAGTAGEPTTDDQRHEQVLQAAATAPVEGTTAVDEPVTAAVAPEGTETAADTIPAKRARKQRFGRRAALTKDQQAAATASVDAITRWLRFDVKAFDPTANLNATITPFDWLTDKTPAGDFDTKAWSINQMAGLFWALVSQYRAERGLALTLPNWGRLCSHVASLDRRTPRGRLIELLIGSVKHFDTVSEWSRQNFRLDESTLADNRFTGAYENLEVEQARERA